MLIGLIISIALAVTFLCLYVCAAQDKASLNKDNEWLRKQRDEVKERDASPQYQALKDSDNRILDKDTVIEAIKANGYSPLDDDDTVDLKRDDIRYMISVDRFPVVSIACGYIVDEKDYDFSLFKQVAREMTDNYPMGKFLIQENEEGFKGIAFQMAVIEKKYGHFRDTLATYLDFIDDMQARFNQKYESLLNRARTAEPGILPEYARKWEA